MQLARRAVATDLSSLLKLYLHLNPDMPRLANDRAEKIWSEILSRPGVKLFVCPLGSRLISTCMLITSPNLMRRGSPHGFIENVVTHRDFRRQGYGKAVISAAFDAAWHDGCDNVMLLTGRGRTDPGVLRFYENCGFQAGIKTGFRALRPDDA